MSNSKRIGRPVDPNSAQSLAHAIYAREIAAGNTDGAAIRAAFVNELKGRNGAPITAGTAQVFYHKARKALGLTVLRPRVAKSDASEAVAEDAGDRTGAEASTETVATSDESSLAEAA